MKIRFSSESMKLATSVDCFFKLQFNESLEFIKHYEVSFSINIKFKTILKYIM